MTKIQARERKAAYPAALAAGRIVRITYPVNPALPHTRDQRFEVCATAEEAERVAADGRAQGYDAQVVRA